MKEGGLEKERENARTTRKIRWAAAQTIALRVLQQHNLFMHSLRLISPGLSPFFLPHRFDLSISFASFACTSYVISESTRQNPLVFYHNTVLFLLHFSPVQPIVSLPLTASIRTVMERVGALSFLLLVIGRIHTHLSLSPAS
jgi:hypothetical protein